MRLLLGVVALGAASFGVWWYVDNYYPYWHFRTVQEGRFYRSSQLDEKDLRNCIDRYGIKTIFNLRDAAERTRGNWYEIEQRVAQEKGVKLVDIPLAAGTPPNAKQVQEMLAVMDDKANLPVLAHCYHGTIRSAAAEGLFRREYMGESGAEAYAQVEKWGRDLEKDYPLIADFIKTYEPRAKKP
jgi:uncharacterized protein (TIGR01244 family)